MNLADNACRTAFQTYVGRSYDLSELFYVFNLPSRATWDFLDDREIVCLLHTFTLSPLTGSMQNSGV